MKKRRLFIPMIILTFTSLMTLKAQTEEGKFLIGGSGNLNFSSLNTKWKTDYNNGDFGKSINLDINAQAGYFILRNCAIGLLVPYSHLKQIDPGESDDFTYKESSISFIPFLSIYFGKSKIKPFIYGGIGPGKGSTKYLDQGSSIVSIPVHITAYEVGTGLGLFINQFISLDLGLGYASAKKKWVDRNTNMNWQTTAKGIGATIGFSFYL